jgi:hypothetical protein
VTDSQQEWGGEEFFSMDLPVIDLPVGLLHEKPVQPRLQKYFASPLTQIKSKILPSRSREEGRLAIVTDVGSGMRWTRQRQAQSLRGRMTLQRTAKSCGSGAPTLALSLRERFRE